MFRCWTLDAEDDDDEGGEVDEEGETSDDHREGSSITLPAATLPPIFFEGIRTSSKQLGSNASKSLRSCSFVNPPPSPSYLFSLVVETSPCHAWSYPTTLLLLLPYHRSSTAMAPNPNRIPSYSSSRSTPPPCFLHFDLTTTFILRPRLAFLTHVPVLHVLLSSSQQLLHLLLRGQITTRLGCRRRRRGGKDDSLFDS